MSPFKKAFSLVELSIVILIIGILIAGVTQGSRVVREMRLMMARTLTKSSDVNSIADIALWLEPTSEKSFNIDQIEDTNQVAQWNNVNPQVPDGRKINAIQGTPGNQPLYVVDGINSLPSLRFDGVDDFMMVADTFDDDTENATIFFVWRPNVTGTTEMDLLEKWEGSGGYPYTLRVNVYYALRVYDTSTSVLVSSATTRTKDKPVIISGRRLKNGTVNIWANGNKEGGDVSDTTSATIGSTANNGRLGICTRSGTLNFCSGDIAEIIIFSRGLSDEERKSVEKYLGKKWGIRVS